MGKKLFLFTLICLCSLWTVAVFAQATAGSVAGQITDEQGAGVPGVTVELRGPAMQGTRTTVTDNQGLFHFVNVPPGDGYNLTASLTGFQSLNRSNFRVNLGKEAHYDMTLRAAMTEAITVTADAPLVDVSRTTTGVNITTEQFENLPTARSFQQLTTLAPGVVMEMGESRTAQLGNSPNVGASSAPENNYIIDGLSTTDARYGTSGTNLTMNFVEEVQVMTGGYSAEYGRSTGGVFNVITKSGGNDFHGDVFGYISEASWGAERANRFSKGSTSQADITDSQDFGVSLGGPIMKDRLWFFGAYNPSRKTIDVGATTDEHGDIIGDAATEFDQDSDFYAGKLTFAATPNHNLVLTAFGDPTTLDGWLLRGIGAPPAEEGAAIRENEVGSDNINFRYTGIITPAWLVEASVGQHKKDYKLSPASEIGRTVPRQVDEVNALLQRGGFQRFQNDEATRDAWTLKFSNFFGGHELRYGVDVEKNEYTADLHETWYRHFGPIETSRHRNECAGHECVFIEERIYTVAGSGQTDNEAAFLQDQWKVLPNLQLNLGVRYEQQSMTSARGVSIGDSFDDVNNGVYDSASEFKFDDNWAPRLGIVYDPMNNGRSKIYGFYGRFYEAIPLDINIRALNGEDYIINAYQHVPNAANPNFWFNPSGNPIPGAVRSGALGAVTENGWTKYRVRELTGATLTPLDADLKLQYQDEYIIGGEYQFGSLWGAGLRLVSRQLERVIEDFGTFTDPEDPSALTGYVIGNPGEGVFGAVYEKPKRDYRAAELTLQRAFANNWQLYSSFVYAEAEGNHEGLFMTGYEQLDPNITALYDIPSFLPNADGKLRADRPYIFKVHSSYTFPFGLTVGEGFYFSAGAPISAQGPELLNGYGDGTIFLTPRGSEGRTPDYWSLDLHADYTLPFLRSANGGLSLILDVLNVTDEDEVLEVDQDYIYQAIVADQGPQFSPWFDDSNLDAFGNPRFRSDLPASSLYKTPILLQSPRTVQVGVKFTY
jgi:outer membrane receptor protein involved in Fe transport